MRRIIKNFLRILQVLRTLFEILILMVIDHGRNKKNIKNIFNINELIVMGNGPSAEKVLSLERGEILKFSILMVNHACFGSIFKVIEPLYYLFIDPVFFEDNLPSGSVKDNVEKTYNILVNNVNWKMFLIVPDRHRKYVINKMQSNTYIKVVGVRVVTLSKFFMVYPQYNDYLENYFSLKGVISLGAQNVLNVALWIALVAKINRVYLLGLDLDWYKFIQLDRVTNHVYIEDKHFYGSEKRFIYQNELKKEYFTMSGIFQAITNMYKIFDKISQASKMIGVDIINLNKESAVDSFRKESLDLITSRNTFIKEDKM